MRFQFFKTKEVVTLEDLKKAYYKLALKHHPDRGGDLETMKVINAEYDALFERVKNVHKTHKGETYTAKKPSQERAPWFRDIVDALMKMDGITIEIIGGFVWVGGDTKPHKEALKALKFKWHSKKVMWYLPYPGYIKYNRKQYTMDEVRDMYGVQFRAEGKATEEEKPKKGGRKAAPKQITA